MIYIFKSEDIRDVDEETMPSPFEIKDVMLFRPRHIAARISTQSALFTVHPDPSAVFDMLSLERIVIKESCKLDLELVLHTYNVNHFTMFPDLDGLSEHLNMWWIHQT